MGTDRSPPGTDECKASASVYVLLVLTIILAISVIILAIYINKLRKSVEMLAKPFGFCNPINTEVELRRKDPKTTGTPSPPPPRPILGSCPWMKQSMESVVFVPSRRGSPKEVFLDSDLSSFVANTATCDTLATPTDNNC